MKHKKIDYCVFCGVKSEITRDHIPPRSLFQKPIPYNINLLTVSSCFKCNNGTSKDDEYFLHFILIGLNQDKSNKKFIKYTFEKLFNPKRRRFLSYIRQNFTDAPVYKNGIYVGIKEAWNFDRKRVQNTLNKIVKGLYYKHTNKILPTEKIIMSEFENISPYNQGSMQLHEPIIGSLPVQDIGNGGVFSYKYWINPNDSLNSIWYLMFYDYLLFMCKS